MTRPRIQNRTVFITGAAGGIGAATAGALVRRGARVALVDVDGDGLHKVQQELGGLAWCTVADVTRESDLRVAVDTAVAWAGRLDAVLVNAAVNHVAPLGDLTGDDFDRIVDVNLGGAVRTVVATLAHLRRTQGYIMLVCSGSGLVQGPFQAPYNASRRASTHWGTRSGRRS